MAKAIQLNLLNLYESMNLIGTTLGDLNRRSTIMDQDEDVNIVLQNIVKVFDSVNQKY